ncbi:MAG: hypothetical protein NTU85_01750 [Candidatus Kaiserbacteria bacterium]|nr:hypothetical protein [Candidatus Kaiserbacteria bacterium]
MLLKKIHSNKFFYFGLFFLCIVLSCFLLYRTEFSWVTLDDKKIEKLSAQATADASNFLFEKNIREFKELSFLYSLKGNTNLAARMMMKVGFQYDKNGDYLTGLPILKKVAFNEKISPEVRSEAIARIVMAYSGNEKKEIMQAIFNDDNQMMKDALGEGNIENKQDLRRAAIHLLEKANSIHEYSYLDYILAARKSYLFIDEMKNISKKEINSRKEEILSLIQRGDELLKKEVNMNDFIKGSFIHDFLPSGQSQKLQAFAELAQVDRIYEKSATSVYNGLKTIKEMYYKNDNSPNYLGTESFIRFYYASMLAYLHGADYKKEIEEIIAPTMIETGNWGIANRTVAWRFYENELTKPEEEKGSNYESIMNIASLLPDFNQFLIEKGWMND